MTPRPEKTWGLFRPLDVLVALAILAGSAFSLPYLSAPWGTRADVFVGREKVARLDLKGPLRRLSVPTGLGPLDLEYGEGSVRVASAPCPNKLCMRMGRVSRSGRAIICLPCRVRIEVGGGGKGHPGELDGVTF